MLRQLLLFLTFINVSQALPGPQAAFISPTAHIPYLTRRDSIILGTSSVPLLTLRGEKPICVIGASGQTGVECVKQLAQSRQPVRAVSRKPIKDSDLEDLDMMTKSFIQPMNVDIKNPQVIESVVRDTSAVIFLANAKKYNRYIKTDAEEFQNYEDIDVFALKNVVKSCIAYKVPKLVFVSASCRSCIESPNLDIDKMSSIKCENCLSKQVGEKLIRYLYNDAKKHSKTEYNPEYTIIRIGFLINGVFNGDARGVKELEINQDYTKSGMISKYDLADLCINAAKNPATASTTFEAYYRDTTQPYDVKESLNKCTILGKSIEECFFGSEFKGRKPKDLEEVRKTPTKGSIFTTGAETSGETWNDLFRNLKKDAVDT